MNKLEKSGAQPKNTVTSVEKNEEAAKSKASSQPQHKRMKRGKYKKLPKSIEFATNLKISNQQRNGLRVVALQGKAKNQKDAISFLLNMYRDSLDNNSQTLYDSLVKSLNQSDSKRYKEEHK